MDNKKSRDHAAPLAPNAVVDQSVSKRKEQRILSFWQKIMHKFAVELLVVLVWTVIGTTLGMYAADNNLWHQVAHQYREIFFGTDFGMTYWSELSISTRFLCMLFPAMILYFDIAQLSMGAVINPVVSLTQFVGGLVPLMDFACLSTAQFLGHYLALTVFTWIFGNPEYFEFQPPPPFMHWDPWYGLLAEALITWIMVFLLYGVQWYVSSRAIRSILTTSLVILFIWTGANTNPAISVSLALHSSKMMADMPWYSQYWIGPVIGAVLGGLCLRIPYFTAKLQPKPSEKTE